MFSLLLVIIYLSFISLGLPDSLLGSAWPVMYQELNVPLSFSGIVFMIIYLGTITSSLCSERVINRYGTGKVTSVSVLLTALGMLGFSFGHIFILLCLFAIPYGLGAGSIDTALNNFVAIHYKSRHMSWLHCMWGVGASVGPYIMSTMLKYTNSWKNGYRTVSFIQFGLSLILFLSLPLWNKKITHTENLKKDEEERKENTKEKEEEKNSMSSKDEENDKSEKETNSRHSIDIGDIKIDHNTGNIVGNKEKDESNKECNTLINIEEEEKEEEEEISKTESNPEVLGLKRTFQIPGVLEAAICFFCYCAVEQTIGLWCSSYLVEERDLNEVTAARFASLFYIGITVGRAITGFVTLRLSDNPIICIGEGIIFIGIIMILIPIGNWIALIGFILAGLGCAPIFPCMVHSTPTNVGIDKSQAVIGVEMASASIGALAMPPLFGVISKWLGLKFLPFYLGINLTVMIFMHYRVMKKAI